MSAALAAVVLTASAASAHECFNTSRSAMADQMIAAHSHGWTDIQTWQILAIFAGTPCDPSQGGCLPQPPGTSALDGVNPELVIGAVLGFADPAVVFNAAQQAAFANLVTFTQAVAAAANQNGVPLHYLTLSQATAAGGAAKSPQGVTSNGKGIDHFPDLYKDQLIAAYVGTYCQAVPGAPICP